MDETTTQDKPSRGEVRVHEDGTASSSPAGTKNISNRPIMSMRRILPVRAIPEDFPVIHMLVSIICEKDQCRFQIPSYQSSLHVATLFIA